MWALPQTQAVNPKYPSVCVQRQELAPIVFNLRWPSNKFELSEWDDLDFSPVALPRAVVLCVPFMSNRSTIASVPAWVFTVGPETIAYVGDMASDGIASGLGKDA